MPFGIQGFNNVTMQNITDLTNFTGDPTKFMLKANSIIYGGWFYFLLLLVLGIILYVVAQSKKDQPLINIMYASTVLTLISFFMRAINMVDNGVVIAMINDFQMWIFPLIMLITGAIVWFTKQ